jgi:hypothetical protein
MTGIQALERIAPGLPMKPGKVERREFEYRRNGTQTLIAAFDITRGIVEGWSETPAVSRILRGSSMPC